MFLPHSPLCTVHMTLKLCIQEYSAISSWRLLYFYISKQYSAIGADLWNKTVDAVDAAPTLTRICGDGAVGRAARPILAWTCGLAASKWLNYSRDVPWACFSAEHGCGRSQVCVLWDSFAKWAPAQEMGVDWRFTAKDWSKYMYLLSAPASAPTSIKLNMWNVKIIWRYDQLAPADECS